MLPLKSNEIFGNWATIFLPVEKDESINWDKFSAQIDILISMKVNGIYSNGTAGEFYNQTEEEFDQISFLLANKCNQAGMPFQIGCNHMSPKISLERVKRIVYLKPGAIQIIIPDWFPPTLPEIISFLETMSDAAQGIGLVLYNPPHAKRKLSPRDFYEIRKTGLPVIGCKLAGGDEAWYASMKSLVPDISLFVPGTRLATGISLGADGAYSNIACLHPRHAQDWYEMMLRDINAAKELESRIQFFFKTFIIPFIMEKKFSDPAIDKFLASITGWSDVGTRLRWPYQWISEMEIPGIRKACKDLLPEFFVGNDQQ